MSKNSIFLKYLPLIPFLVIIILFSPVIYSTLPSIPPPPSNSNIVKKGNITKVISEIVSKGLPKLNITATKTTKIATTNKTTTSSTTSAIHTTTVTTYKKPLAVFYYVVIGVVCVIVIVAVVMYVVRRRRGR